MEPSNNPQEVMDDPNRVQPMTPLQEEIKSHIIECLELDIDPSDLQLETPLFDPEWGLGLDSLESLEIVTELSNAYGVTFDDSQMEDFISVKTLSAFVEKKLKEKKEAE